MTVVNIIAQLPVSNNIAQLPGLGPGGAQCTAVEKTNVLSPRCSARGLK